MLHVHMWSLPYDSSEMPVSTSLWLPEARHRPGKAYAQIGIPSFLQAEWVGTGKPHSRFLVSGPAPELAAVESYSILLNPFKYIQHSAISFRTVW